MKEFLTEEQIRVLRHTHKSLKDKKLADRIKAILSLNAGFSYTQIATILLLDEITLRRYIEKFQEKGVDGVLEYRYSGGNQDSVFCNKRQSKNTASNKHLKQQKK